MHTEHGYEIDQLDILAETPELRVRILTLGSGQGVPWHRHTVIDDTFVCLEGPMRIHVREPDGCHELAPGERVTVHAGQPHLVEPAEPGACRFLIVQGVGTYDYVPEP